MPSKFPKATLIQEATALYTDPNVYELANLVIEQSATQDRSRTFTCFMLDIEARVYGNRQAVAGANKDMELWRYKRRLVKSFTGQDLLAPRVPSPDTVRKWRERLVPPEDVSPDNDVLPPILGKFLESYTRLAVERATQLGNFSQGRTRDFTRNPKTHAVLADGTYIEPWSKAQTWTDHTNTTHLLHSRAKSPASARTQHYVGGTKAGRGFMGVNQTAAVTKTRYGRVHLGLIRAFHGEPAAITAVMDQILAHAGDGVHTLVYDKGITNWPQQYLMANYGVFVRTPVTRKSSEDPETTAATLDAKKAIKKAQGNGKKVLNIQANALATHELNQRHKVAELIASLEDGESIGAGLPLGTSQYVNSAGNVEQSRSNHYFYDTFSHPVPDTGDCVHELHVDHGALWETEITNRGLIKTQRLTCTGSTAVKTGDHYELHTTHNLTCRHTGELLQIEPTKYVPSPERGRATTRTTRTVQERAVEALRPVAECDATWRKCYARRNNIESWFSMLKSRLPSKGQAASLDLNHQFLDTLYVGLITNALALRQYRLQHPQKP